MSGSAAGESATNLPPDATSFVGRRRELAQVKRSLSTSRLVTLTGVGGVGKTRLAVRTAAGVRRAFPDGVWLVDLAELRAPTMLARTVGFTLGVPSQSCQAPLVALADQLADRRLLVVLDNCEHLLAACGQLVYTLLGACPLLRVLATSREPLGICGETIYPVPPLSVPGPAEPWRRPEVARYEAMALFADRAAATVPGFGLTEHNYGSVAGICRQLDGLPLAIELAAVRLREFSPQQILDRLTDRYTLLIGGCVHKPLRHQTLHRCIRWSFELCSVREQLLWARLSVFTGSFALDAVEAVCAGDGLPRDELLDLVTGLVDKSVLVLGEREPELRYRLLDTLREFGLRKLHGRAEETRLRSRHGEWLERLLSRGEREWISSKQLYWLTRLNQCLPNIRSTLQFYLSEPGRADSALRMAVAAWRVRRCSPGGFSESRHWIEQALAVSTEPSVHRMRALLVDSQLAVMLGDLGVGRSLLAEGRVLAERLGDSDSLSWLGYATGHVELWAGDLPAAIAAYEQGLAARSPDLNLRVDTLFGLLAAVALSGDTRRALAWHREILAITEPVGERRRRSHSWCVFGLSVWRCGDLRLATELQHQSLRLKHGLNDLQGTAFCLEALAWIAAEDQRDRRAATLLGAAEALWRSFGVSLVSWQPIFEFHQQCERSTRGRLGGKRYRAAFRQGSGLAFDEMVAYALEEQPPAVALPAPPCPTPLTRREQQVAELVARGASNSEVADALVISQRTAEDHIEHILIKLGFTSRMQIMSWVFDQQSLPRRD
jgi:predicted ATPase/DNA-binding CsgD family transcriptional regulator